VATQGYYFLYHAISTFDAASHSAFGYKLGSFRRVVLGETVAIEHCGFAKTSLAGVIYGP